MFRNLRKIMYFTEYDSPIGTLLLTCREDALTGLWMNRLPPENACRREDHPIFLEAKRWLDRYFRGENPSVTVPLCPAGTPFRQQVWQLLRAIPYGETCSYGDLARQMAAILGKETMSAQAIGQAVGSNPISIFIPCHRVVGAKGQLTGYAGGIDKKIWLLRHEGQQGIIGLEE